MSSEIAISVEQVSKIYPIYTKPLHKLLEILDPRKQSSWRKDFVAVKPTSFKVKRGHTVGIVGRNGSGKSTLLQMICGTLSPTTGSVQVNGRLAALLELGAGFNAEFTGLENIYMNATILGLARPEIDSRLEEILRFADIGEFVHQPVKNYSSGMFVRLAFAVAVNVDPDILVVDEALSVGDEAFQRKCFAKIEAIRSRGCTILFVSHSAGTVADLCDYAILMDAGQMLTKGDPKKVISLYQKLIYAGIDQQPAIRKDILTGAVSDQMATSEVIKGENSIASETSQIPDGDSDAAWYDPNMASSSTVVYESRGATIVDPHFETLSGRRVNMLAHGEKYCYRYRVYVDRTLTRARFGMMFRTLTGIEIGGSASDLDMADALLIPKGKSIDVRFKFVCSLNPGVYFSNAGCLSVEGDYEVYAARIIDAAMFKVIPSKDLLATGTVNFVTDTELDIFD